MRTLPARPGVRLERSPATDRTMPVATISLSTTVAAPTSRVDAARGRRRRRAPRRRRCAGPAPRPPTRPAAPAAHGADRRSAPRARRRGGRGDRGRPPSARGRRRRRGRRPGRRAAPGGARRRGPAPRRRCGAARAGRLRAVALALPADDAAPWPRSPRAPCSAPTPTRATAQAPSTHKPGRGRRRVQRWPRDAGRAGGRTAPSVLAAAVALTRDLVNTPPSDLPRSSSPRRPRTAAEAAGIERRGARREGAGQGRLRRHPRRRPGVDRPAAAGEADATRRRGRRAPPRAGRQGHHVRLRRPLAQAAAGDDDDEVRHGRRGRRRSPRSRAIARLGLPVRVTAYAADRREHALGHGAAAVGRAAPCAAGRPSRCSTPTPRAGWCWPTRSSDACEDAARPASSTSPRSPAPQMVALGARTSAIMSNRRRPARRACRTPPTRAGEAMWPMPLPAELRGVAWTPPVADIANMGDRFGGMLVAGLFLQEFVGEGTAVGAPGHRRARPSTTASPGATPRGRHRRGRAHPGQAGRGPRRRRAHALTLRRQSSRRRRGRRSAQPSAARRFSSFWRAFQSRIRAG